MTLTLLGYMYPKFPNKVNVIIVYHSTESSIPAFNSLEDCDIQFVQIASLNAKSIKILEITTTALKIKERLKVPCMRIAHWGVINQKFTH